MLDFFKRDKNKIAKDGDDFTVDSMELLGEQEETTGVEVKTKLHYPAKLKVTQEEKYYYQFLNNELPLLKENQISLSGIELKLEDGNVMVRALIRSSLKKAITFQDKASLLLLDPEGKPLAHQAFDLTELGEIPAESSVPWVFMFQKQNVTGKEIPQTDWKLAFEIEKPHALDLEESWEKSLAATTKERLEKLVNDMAPPKSGEVNFVGIQALINEEDGSLHTTLLIRNGSKKNINFEQLPLAIRDASDEVVAEGSFHFKQFEVKANTSKPWTFMFPRELVLKEKIDLSSWKASIPKGE